MPKNVQTTAQLHWSQTLAKSCSKFFKLGFSSMWTENFQMFKLDWEKAEEWDVKLPTFIGSWRKQRNSRKTPASASLTVLKPLTVWIATNCGKFLKRWNSRPPYLSLEKLHARQEAQLELVGTMDWFKIGKGVCQGCILLPCLFNFYAEYIIQIARLEESQAGVKISGRNINNLRYADTHPYGRKWRTKEPFDEG